MNGINILPVSDVALVTCLASTKRRSDSHSKPMASRKASHAGSWYSSRSMNPIAEGRS
jgi:hypothetical protein